MFLAVNISAASGFSAAWRASGMLGMPRSPRMSPRIGSLMRTKQLVVAQAETVWKAVRLFKEGKADFADCLVERCGSDAGCSATFTFDVGAAKHCGMRLID